MNLRQSERILSLDAFRGITIAGMILVNTPGSWGHVYAPLRHAGWHGWTPTDLIFPFFLFIVGVAMSFSFSKHISQSMSTKQLHLKIIKRFLIIFGLGLFLNAYPFNIPFSLTELKTSFHFSDIIDRFETLRIMGVLQRIAICYLFASLITLNMNKKGQWIISAVILVLYWLIMFLYNAGYDFADKIIFPLENNLIRKIDLLILGKAHMYKVNGIPFDPEGILSTLPATVSVLIGVFIGDILRFNKARRKKVIDLIFLGFLGIFIGKFLELGFPINKQLWSPSYTVFTAGWATLFLSVCYWLIDVKHIKFWAKPFIIFGSNSIFVFVASGLLVKTILKIKILYAGKITSLYSYLYKTIFMPAFGDINGSLSFAITWIILWLIVLTYLYQKKIFIKI